MSRFVKGVVVKTGQGWFCLDPDDRFVSKSLLESGAYGLAEIEQARQFCEPEARVPERVRRGEFLATLQRMFDAGHGDAGIIFRK